MSETQNFDGEITPPTRTKCGGWIRCFLFQSGTRFLILPLFKEVLPVVAVDIEDVFIVGVGVPMISFEIGKKNFQFKIQSEVNNFTKTSDFAEKMRNFFGGLS